jgi:hypothetical protein
MSAIDIEEMCSSVRDDVISPISETHRHVYSSTPLKPKWRGKDGGGIHLGVPNLRLAVSPMDILCIVYIVALLFLGFR